MLKRRLSNPRAATTIALAAVLAAAVAVTPSFAGSLLVNKKASRLYLTNKQASKQYLSNKKASSLYLKKKAASNTFVQKATAPLTPVAGIAAGTAQYGPTATVATPVAGYIPTAFTSFATKGNGPAVITFSGNVVCTAAKPTADVACPIEILIDGQKTGKINFAPATAESPAPCGPGPVRHPDHGSAERRPHRRGPVPRVLESRVHAERLEPRRPGLPAAAGTGTDHHRNRDDRQIAVFPGPRAA